MAVEFESSTHLKPAGCWGERLIPYLDPTGVGAGAGVGEGVFLGGRGWRMPGLGGRSGGGGSDGTQTLENESTRVARDSSWEHETLDTFFE